MSTDLSAVPARSEAGGETYRGPAPWVVLVAVLVLGAVSADVRFGGLLTHLDHTVGRRMQDWDLRDTTWPNALLHVPVLFGQRGVVLPLSALLMAWLGWRNRTVEPLLRLALALVCLVLVVYAFKLGIARTAPAGYFRGDPPHDGASYPSGHVANGILLWGLADWAVLTWPTPQALRRCVRAGRWIAPVAIAVGMTLLNYHWISDFVGGAAAGIILLAVTTLPYWQRPSAELDRRLFRGPAGVHS